MKLSIVTVNYNNFRGLKETVESVLLQTWKGFEYVVIDGGSTDGSAEFLSEKSEHFSYWVSETDAGVYSAMNKGIKASKGEYLLFLNSGDTLCNAETLERASSFLHTYDLVVGFCERQKARGKRQKLGLRNKGEKVLFSSLWGEGFPHQGTFIRRELFDRVGLYDEGVKISADWQFFMRAVFGHGATYGFVDEVISILEDGGISCSPGSLATIRKEKEEFLLQHPEIWKDGLVRAFLEQDTTLDSLKRSRLIKRLVAIGFFSYLKKLFSS